MYLEFFGLRELPFALAPNTDSLIELASHRRALESVLHALEHDESVIKITGEAGVGKTLLLRCLQCRLVAPWFVIALYNRLLTPDGLLLAVAEELGLPVDGDKVHHRLPTDIEARLQSLKQTGFRVVMLVDEAQALPQETLQALRLLTNLDSSATPLLQVVLAATPGLDTSLQQEALRALQQRISRAVILPALQPDELAYYVNQRLARAGFAGHNLFSRPAIERLYTASGGIPRLANVLAHKALLVAYGRGDTRIGPAHVQRAIDDTGSPVAEQPTRPQALAARISYRLQLLPVMLMQLRMFCCEFLPQFAPSLTAPDDAQVRVRNKSQAIDQSGNPVLDLVLSEAKRPARRSHSHIRWHVAVSLSVIVIAGLSLLLTRDTYAPLPDAPVTAPADNFAVMDDAEPASAAAQANFVANDAAPIDETPSVDAKLLSPSPFITAVVADDSDTAVAAPTSAVTQGDIEQLLTDWTRAWQQQDLPAYFAVYATSFVPANGASRERWQADRTRIIGNARDIRIKWRELDWRMLDAETISVELVLDYEAAGYRDATRKQLLLQRQADGLRITEEVNLAVERR